MSKPDLNLLFTLEVLLAEGSVAGAARKLRLSPSAMSRALARLRNTMRDPLLVRAGGRLVPTPRAEQIRTEVGQLVREAQAILMPKDQLDPKSLARTFTLRSSDGFAETFGPRLIARIRRESPGVRMHFLQKPNKDSSPLREGSVDLETGVIEQTTAPELRVQSLFHDRYVGVVRKGHPLSRGKISASIYQSAEHVSVSRQGMQNAKLEEDLLRIGIQRNIVASVSGFSAALALARFTDLVATVPERHTESLRVGMHTFLLPVSVPTMTISLLWHPRMDADPGHRWIRQCILEICVDRNKQTAPAKSPR